jgi:DnaJ-domain-containing protein 1
MPRPLIQLGVGDLEAFFAKSKTDAKALKQLEHELQYRQVPRAVALLARVRAALSGEPPATIDIPATGPAPVPQQSGLWERPSKPAPAPLVTPVAASRPAARVKVSDSPATEGVQPRAPVIPISDAYKLLKATAGSTWELIEQTRRQLVQKSHPDRLGSMSAEGRAQVLAESKRVNAAYAVLSQARCGGR